MGEEVHVDGSRALPEQESEDQHQRQDDRAGGGGRQDRHQ